MGWFNIILKYLLQTGDTTMDIAILKLRLIEAEEAYHQLSMGKRVVRFVDSNGETVEYHSGSASQLSAYIAELRRAIAGSASSAPLTVFF